MRKRATTKKRTLLIDGDIILYQQAFTNQKKIDWGDGVVSEWTNPEMATKGCIDYIEWMRDLLHANEILVMVTGGENFRRELNPSYKANRTSAKPLLYEHVVDVLNKNFTVISEARLEADDLMGIYATDTRFPGEKIICSLDKDLATIPGAQLFNPNRSTQGTRRVSPEEARMRFFMQLLMGDPVDGYYGIKGIGPKKAEKILHAAQDEEIPFWDAVCQQYLAHGLTTNDALMTARMAHILVAGEYDFQAKKVKLWNP